MTMDIRGAHVHYRQYGHGKPLLLLHGWGGKIDSFLPVTRDFQATRQITVLDFPGHGESSEPPEAWSVTEYMEMTAELIRQLSIAHCDIIAHSFGGRVAILLAATYPELVNRMVLTGCAGLIPKPSGKRTSVSGAYRLLRALADNALTRALLGEGRVETLRQSLRQKYGSQDYKALKTDVMRATFNRVIRQDLESYLPMIKAPTLLIFGENDTATPLWMGQVMEKLIPDAGLVTFPDAGHFAYLEKYAEFKLIVDKFLNA